MACMCTACHLVQKDEFVWSLARYSRHKGIGRKSSRTSIHRALCGDQSGLELRNDEQAGRGVVYSLMSQVKTGLSVCRVWVFHSRIWVCAEGQWLFSLLGFHIRFLDF